LNELAAALGDDPNFATTVTNSIALKAPLASPSFTGAATFNSTVTSTGLTVNAGTDKVVLANNFATTGNTDSPKLAFYSFGDVATYPVSGPSIKKVNTGSYGAGDLVIYQHGPTDFTNEVEALRISSSGAATFSSSVTADGQLTSARGSDTGTYGFRHEGAGKYMRMGVANASFAYFETDANGGFSFEGNVTVPNQILHAGDTDTYMQFHAANEWRVVAGGYERFAIGQHVVVNEDSHDSDFRVESNGNTHMLFVDGGNNCVSAGGGNSPAGSNWGFYAEGQTKDTSSNTYTAAKFASAGYVDTGEYTTMLGMGVEKSAYWSKGGMGYTRTAGYDVGYLGFYVNGAITNANLTLADEVLRLTPAEVVVNDRSRSTVDFRVESDSNAYMLFVDAGANIVAFGQTQNIAGGGMYFNHSNATRSHLVVSNTETSYGESLYYGNRQNSDGQIFQFRRSNSNVGNISVDTNSTTYNTTSDLRLKKDIETITDGTDKLMAMNPVMHGWKADPEADAVHGFIAQEMLDIVPEAVSGDPEGEDMMSMDYGRITPVIVAALQEANKKIMELENRINELEGK
jgi:hypothetical protein